MNNQLKFSGIQIFNLGILLVLVGLLGLPPVYSLEHKDEPANQADMKNALKIEEQVPKLILKPGQPIEAGMQAEDIVVTDDVDLAKEQVAAYPDSPEASFVLAVALTRTSMVEQALKEVRRARRLADGKGGPAYFDHMIAAYEEMLKSYPDDNKVRYGLAWAYYMKAYVLNRYGKDGKVSAAVNTNGSIPADKSLVDKLPNAAAVSGSSGSSEPWHKNWVSSLAQVQTLTQGTTNPKNQPEASPPTSGQTPVSPGNQSSKPPLLQGVLEKAPPNLVPQIKSYYEAALRNLDELLTRQPSDVWARVYRAFLNAEYTGNLDQAMAVWHECQAKNPDNPAPYFFLGEGYLKQGNLKESLQNISKAIALRSLGK